jgi:phasin family protein
MSSVPSQIAEFNQSVLQAAINFAHLSVENAERLVHLQLDSAKAAIEDSAEHAKALTEVKDVQELASLRAKLAETTIEKALSYSRSLYDLANEAQGKVSQLVEEQLTVFSENMVTAVENAAKSAPAGAEVAVAAVKSSVAATTAAVDSFKRAAKQAAGITDDAVKSAQRATVTAVKSAKTRK